ncbi:helix-turn-helix domain-containing protein, partial [Listeria valentina]|uniref:helix-turn-helix domain-containing protein n=1 Tax=Listeria valentina TaxID=2705293 RepID=UPI001430EE45
MKNSQNCHNLCDYKYFGRTIKHIRKLKGMQQSEVCGDTIPLSTYRKIEYDLLKPDTEVFLIILSNLNTTISEFIYIHEKNFRVTKDKLLREYKDLTHS